MDFFSQRKNSVLFAHSIFFRIGVVDSGPFVMSQRARSLSARCLWRPVKTLPESHKPGGRLLSGGRWNTLSAMNHHGKNHFLLLYLSLTKTTVWIHPDARHIRSRPLDELTSFLPVHAVRQDPSESVFITHQKLIMNSSSCRPLSDLLPSAVLTRRSLCSVTSLASSSHP